MADDLTIGIGSTVDDHGMRQAAAALGAVADAADELGDQARPAADAVDDLGDELGAGTNRARGLAAAAEEIRARVAELAATVHATGDLELLKGLRSDLAQLRQIDRVNRDLERMGITAQAAGTATAGALDEVGDQARQAARAVDDLDDELGGLGRRGGIASIGADLLGGLRTAASSAPDAVMAGLSSLPGKVGEFFAATGPVGAAVAAATAATMVSAVAAGVAGAGIGAAAAAAIGIGIAGAAQSPSIKAAGTALKESLAAELASIGAPFVASVHGAMKTIKDEVPRLGLREAFAPLAGLVNPLTDGLFLMAKAALPGVKSLIQATVPFVLQLVDEMPELGEAVGDFAESIAEAGPGAAKFFHLLIVGAEVVLTTLGDVIEVFSKVYNFIATLGEKIGLYDFGNAQFTELGDTAGTALRQIETTAAAADTQLLSLADTLDALSGKNISAIEAESAFQAAVDAATASVREHGASLDLDTEAGRQNMAALVAIAKTSGEAAQAIFNQTYAEQGETQAQNAAAAAWQRGRDQLIALAQGMGASRERAEALANQIMGIPNFRNVTVSVDVSPAEAALARIRGQINALGRAALPGEAAQYYGQMTGIPGRARGGPVKAGEAYIVGERRPELFVPTTSGVVLPDVPALAGMPMPIALPAGAIVGQAPTATLVLASGGGRLEDLLIEVIRVAVDRGGGNVQAVLGRRGA